jgi:hypothetical protein
MPTETGAVTDPVKAGGESTAQNDNVDRSITLFTSIVDGHDY